MIISVPPHPGLALALMANLFSAPPVTVPNPNTRAAGTLRDGVLSLEFVATESRWHADGGAVTGSPVQAFAESGGRPSIPGPLIRAPAGTVVRLRIRNTLPRRITFFMPTSPSTDDSVIVDAASSGDIETRLTTPGNYIYRATDGTRASKLLRIGSALAGAVVVDSAAPGKRPRDRVMMILMTPDSANVADKEADSTLGPFDGRGRANFSINGLSWPKTPRIAATVGDTLHWRIINGSLDVHPMHLHGFYFTVDQFTGLLAARDGQGAPGRLVVTERMSVFSAMSMTWIPERPGNWLLHCHFALHLLPYTATSGSMPATEHENHALTGMQGLVMGVTVAPRRGDRIAAEPAPARHLRVVAIRDSSPAEMPLLRFVIDEAGKRQSAGPGFSPTLYLTRNQPVAITVVNELEERTAIHWHGMELESYYDGVAGLSGSGKHLAPTIAPGDSFDVRFTPPRAGTFMYHSHVDDVRQQRAGLLGAMIVRDGPATPMPDDYEIFLKGAVNPGPGRSPIEINGRTNPDTLVLHEGRPARFRLMSLVTENPNATVFLTARPDSAFRIPWDSLLVQWIPVAKDGADLPAGARAPRMARQTVSMGETYDFEYTPK
ncbi:MAG TPA: multicopper oxidase domain-containing protein, partial [Gemmatimonadales bacterium]|nr:multicopper oxidase domain-containing protein [Gemmatimonadales bacterium]